LAHAKESRMPDLDQNAEQTLRERAYFLWEQEGRPEGRARSHWERATIERFGHDPGSDGLASDEEKVLAGHASANIPAMLTKDVLGG
jgi:hypothetical protein